MDARFPPLKSREEIGPGWICRRSLTYAAEVMWANKMRGIATVKEHMHAMSDLRGISACSADFLLPAS